MRLIKQNDKVHIIDGAHAGTIGWVWRIEVEPTKEFKAIVVITVQLSRPYGHMVEVMPNMVEIDTEPCVHDWELLQEADAGYLCRKCGARHYDESIKPPALAHAA